MLASLTITKHDGASKPQTVTVKVEDTATLSALRAIAQSQSIMSSQDLFKVANSNISLPKAREERLIWTDIQDPEDDSVHINVGGKSFSAKDGLTVSEKDFLFQKSRIGFGFDAAGEEGPKYTNRPVVAELSLDRIAFAYGDEGQQDIVTTYSSRSSSYLKAGWVDASLAAKTPWADIGVEASLSQSSAGSESQKHLYITGRYNFAHCTMSMKDYVSQLKPHPDFNERIMKALALPNELQRTQEIKRVLAFYGSMFVTSVEVGGMKHSTTEKILDAQATESSVKKEMRVTLGKKFGPADVEAKVGGGTKTTQTQQQENEFEALHFYTVGGAIEEQSVFKWRESLSDPRKWGVTRVLEVQSVLALFDKQTQLKIALSVFKTPLYQFRDKAGRHCLSTEQDPSKLPVTKDSGLWASDGPIGAVLTTHIDGAVPLYHIYNGTRHGFTTSQDERNKHINEWGFWDQGIACYVYNDQKPGTIPLSRTYNSVYIDDAFFPSMTKEDVEAAQKWGYIADGTRWYIYPAPK